MSKIILEEKYFIKSMIYDKLKLKNRLFHPEMIQRPLFWFKDTKKYSETKKQKKTKEVNFKLFR